MALEDNPTGVPLFDSVVQQKQAELLRTTQQKLSDTNSTSIPSMLDRIRTASKDANLPSLSERAADFSAPVQKQTGPYFASVESQGLGLGYLEEVAGSFVAGVGITTNAVISSPNEIIQYMQNSGVSEKLSKYSQKNFPEQQTILARAAELGIKGAAAIDAYGDELQSKRGGFLATSEAETADLSRKVSQAYDDNSGAVDVTIAMLGKVANNPEGIPGIIAESLPTMIALSKKGALFATTFVGMAGQRIDDSIAVYKDSHEGRTPTGNDYQIIAIGAIISTAVETVESRFLLSKHSKVAKATAEKTARLAGIPGVATVLKGAQGGIAEAGEEGIAELITQATGKGDFSTEGLLSDGVIKPAAVAATIGFGPGAAIKGGTQVLPDTGKVAKKGIQAVSAGVEKAVTVNTEKRLKKAEESGDVLATVEIGLEKDISQQPAEDRKKHVLSLLDKMEDAHDTHDAMEKGAEKTAFKVKLDTLTNQINRVMAASQEASKAEAGETSTVEAEKIIREATASAEGILSAMQTVAADIQKGVAAQPTIVEKILGSTQFEELSDDLQETVTLYNNATKLEQIAKENRTTKGLEDVAQDIEHGNPGDRFIGTKQQQEIVASSISVGNQARANKSVQQLHNLRATILKKLANPAKGKDGKIFGTGAHGQSFVNQLTKEAQSITATMELLNSNIEAAFGEKALSAEKISSPPIQVYGGAATSTPASTDKKTTTTKKPTISEESTVSKQETVQEPKAEKSQEKETKSKPVRKPVHESLYIFLRRQGGIDVSKDPALAKILRPYNKDKIGVAFGLKGIAQNGKGMTITEATEAAVEAGYIGTAENDVIDESILYDILTMENAGEDTFTAEGQEEQAEIAAEQEAEDRFAEEEEQEAQSQATPEPEPIGEEGIGTGILDVVIPAKSKYTGSKLDKKITRGRTTFSKTYKSAIIDLDNALRAVQQVMRECNV